MRSTRRPTRRPRRVRRVRRAKRGIRSTVPRRSLQFKPYNYRFKPPPQLLVASSTVAAPNQTAWQFSIVNDAGALPLTNNATNLQIIGSSTGLSNFCDIGLACTFKLDDCITYQSFTQLYDAYKITKVSLTIEYLNNVSGIGGAALMPTIYMYYDQDDANVPTSQVRVIGKQGMRLHHFNTGKQAKTTFKFSPTIPQLAIADAEGTISQAMVASKPQWIDCAAPSVPHYAFKALITDLYAPGVPVVNVFRLNWTYDVQFRSPVANF